MTERTIIAVVSEFRATGLTVEQQILMDELIILTANLQAMVDAGEFLAQQEEERRGQEVDRKEAQRTRWREDKRVQRTSKDVQRRPSDKKKGPHTPKEKITTPLDNPTGYLPPNAFEEFWAVYPRKIGKGAARKAYRNALKRASSEEILAGAKRYAASKPEPQFTAHASTWLNADRWLDEPEHKLMVVGGAPTRSYREQMIEAGKLKLPIPHRSSA